MDPAVFRQFRDLAYAHAGISLRPGKESLVTARIGKRLKALGLKSERQYLALLQSKEADEEVLHFLDAISTNFTSFFREKDHFDLINEAVAIWYAEGQRRFRFWSAASSTGEEPYSLAITLAEAFTNGDVDNQILATDISTRVLDAAKRGTFNPAQVSPVPPGLRSRYFVAQGKSSSEDRKWQVNEQLRKQVTFNRLNLAKPPFPLRGPFDAIFCRNVMIYFDNDVRQGLVYEFERLLRSGGLLLVGHAETLNGIQTSLVMVRPSVYRKPSE